MTYTKYNLYEPRLSAYWTLIDAKVIYDDQRINEGYFIKGWYEPNYKIGFKLPLDGNIYLDWYLRRKLIKTGVSYKIANQQRLATIIPLIGAIIVVYYAPVNNTVVPELIISVNRDKNFMLVYAFDTLPQNYYVELYHHKGIYKNVETNGVYDNQVLPAVVKLLPDQYALFYNDYKPTVNQNAPYGLTDQKPFSLTSRPQTYVEIDGKYFSSDSDLCFKVITDRCHSTALINDIVVTEEVMLHPEFRLRNGVEGDHITFKHTKRDCTFGQFGTTHALGTTLIYDYDPYAGISWEEGHNVTHMGLFVANNKTGLIIRGLKTTVKPFKVRYTFLSGIYFYDVQQDYVKVRIVKAYKTITNVTSYGAVNQVVNPGIKNSGSVIPGSVEYYDGSNWNPISEPTDSYVYYNANMVRFQADPYHDGSLIEHIVLAMRMYGGYGSPPIKVGALKFSATNKTLVGMFTDYGGSTIPQGEHILQIFDASISKSGQYIDIGYEQAEKNDILWLYLYGKAYSMIVSLDTILRVTVDGAEGKGVHVINKDTDTEVCSGVIQNNEFECQPNAQRVRVFIEGDDLDIR
jgi:hypothetical protein